MATKANELPAREPKQKAVRAELSHPAGHTAMDSEKNCTFFLQFADSSVFADPLVLIDNLIVGLERVMIVCRHRGRVHQSIDHGRRLPWGSLMTPPRGLRVYVISLGYTFLKPGCWVAGFLLLCIQLSRTFHY